MNAGPAKPTGAPVAWRLALKHPDRVTGLIVQNGNAYDEGLDNDFWKPIKAYWKEPTNNEKRDAIRNLVTYDAMKRRAKELGMPAEMLEKNDIVIDGALRSQSIAACVGCALAGIVWAVIRIGQRGYRGEFEQPSLERATGVLREAFFIEQGIDRVLVRPLRNFSRLLLAGVVEARILDRVVVSGGAGVARRAISGKRRAGMQARRRATPKLTSALTPHASDPVSPP